MAATCSMAARHGFDQSFLRVGGRRRILFRRGRAATDIDTRGERYQDRDQDQPAKDRPRASGSMCSLGARVRLRIGRHHAWDAMAQICRSTMQRNTAAGVAILGFVVGANVGHAAIISQGGR